jgi:hypothetical protein
MKWLILALFLVGCEADAVETPPIPRFYGTLPTATPVPVKIQQAITAAVDHIGEGYKMVPTPERCAGVMILSRFVCGDGGEDK